MSFKSLLKQSLPALLMVSHFGTPASAKSSRTSQTSAASQTSRARQPNSAPERPPQYVLLAFDGSYTLSIWDELRALSKDYIAENKNIRDRSQEAVDMKFTFFINPIYLIHRGIPNGYTAPAPFHGSAIGYGDSAEDDNLRIIQMTLAHKDGHEIANHAVGHWNGSKWNAGAWKMELDQFYSIMDNVFTLNKIPAFPKGVKRPIFMEPQISGLTGQKETGMVGFRAPQLGDSPGLYEVLPSYGVKYDTSQIASRGDMTYWPEKKYNGLWNIPLVSIPIPGEARFYPTMDYNFCANDTLFLLRDHPELVKYVGVDPTNGKQKGNRVGTDCLNVVPPQIKAQMQSRMVGAYMNYFNNNYYGRRAPVTIGHHFSKWMGGAYYDAMLETAKIICKKPEVQCITHRAYMNILEDLSQNKPELYAAYRKGDFEKLAAPKAVRFEVPRDLSANMTLQEEQLKVSIAGKDAAMKGLATKYFVNNKQVEAKDFNLRIARRLTPNGQDAKLGAALYDRQGKELLSVTHRLEKVGTAKERFNLESLEDHFRKGDPIEAHSIEPGL